MGIFNGLNTKFTKEKFVELVFVLSVLNIIFIIALGFFVFQFLDSGKIGTKINPNEKTGEAVRFPVQPPIELPKVLYNLSGKITKVEKDAVIFDAVIFSKDAKGEIASGVEPRKANIDSAVNINRLVFVKNSPIESAIKLSDLKVGDYIEVISDQDISDAAEFSVTLVRVLP